MTAQLPASLIAALAAALLSASAAAAQEVIRTGPEGAPPAPAAPPGTDDQSPEAIGAWARGVLAGQSAAPADPARAARPSRCAAPPDRKPHGAVWGGVGTGGYREVGGVVTQPIGDCSSVTVAIDHVQADYGRRR